MSLIFKNDQTLIEIGLRHLVAVTLFLAGLSAEASIKIRAREHFDVHQIERNGSSETYRGLSNTINLWYEKPYDLSFGLSFNPVLGSAEREGSSLTEVGDQIRFIHVGLEAKYFILTPGLFTRVGAGWTQLRTKSSIETSNGHHGYMGLGWEFDMGKFGLALEAAYRLSWLDNDIEAQSLTPSIGFHFYEAF